MSERSTRVEDAIRAQIEITRNATTRVWRCSVCAASAAYESVPGEGAPWASLHTWHFHGCPKAAAA